MYDFEPIEQSEEQKAQFLELLSKIGFNRPIVFMAVLASFSMMALTFLLNVAILVEIPR